MSKEDILKEKYLELEEEKRIIEKKIRNIKKEIRDLRMKNVIKLKAKKIRNRNNYYNRLKE